MQCYSGMAVIGLAAVEDGVVLYPDHLRLQLRMDTGEVVGLEANQYLMNHTRRSDLQPVLTKEQAQEKVSTQAEMLMIALAPEETEFIKARALSALGL